VEKGREKVCYIKRESLKDSTAKHNGGRRQREGMARRHKKRRVLPYLFWSRRRTQDRVAGRGTQAMGEEKKGQNPPIFGP